MNADSFVKYLKDSSFLHQISYQELKTLSLQYPYCQNLHLLLLKKSLLDNHKDQEQNLERAAAYSFDRTHLFHQMKSINTGLSTQDSFLLSEEYLELKDLSEIGKTMDMIDAEPEKEPQKALELENIPAPSSSPDENFTLEEDTFSEDVFQLPTVELPSVSADQATPSYHLSDNTINTLVAFAGIIPQLKAQKNIVKRKKTHSLKKPALSSRPLLHKLKQLDAQQRGQARPVMPTGKKPNPQPKKSFNSWLEQFQEPAIKSQLDEIMEHKKLEEVKKKSKKTKKRKHQMLQVAVKSITENQEVVSETLAELLVRQGRYDKAIEMYKRLLLLFPEKSDYFASKIDNLKSI